jgi:intracellular sulfur oxidation DsrE/DsrF family protein
VKQVYTLSVAAGLLLAVLYFYGQPTGEHQDVRLEAPAGTVDPVPPDSKPPVGEDLPGKAVLDVSVHTLEELRVLFDRAEQLAMTPRPEGEDASVVLVLHGPEVEFFSIRNYDTYKEIVDQAARLDAFDVVDVKICQTMLSVQGVAREDIPSFIEQVPFGDGEIDRLIQEGYVSF